MSVLHDNSVRSAKVAMSVQEAAGRLVMRLRLDRHVLDLLAAHDRVTVVADDLDLDCSVPTGAEGQDFRYVTIDVTGH